MNTIVKNNVHSKMKWKLVNAGAEKNNENAAAKKSTSTVVMKNRDSFRANTQKKVVTYSPDTVKTSLKDSAKVRALSTTRNVATTTSQMKNIPRYLAAKMAGVSCDSYGNPSINSRDQQRDYENALSQIRGDHANLSYKESYCYSQTGNSYGYTDATTSCSTYALATALSIKEGRQVTPDQIATDSATSGHGTRWEYHNAYSIAADEESTLFAIDAQLELGNPVLIHTTGLTAKGEASEHWATVIGKKNGEYTIIDPYYGDVRNLSDMQIYKNSGSIVGYVILSNEY